MPLAKDKRSKTVWAFSPVSLQAGEVGTYSVACQSTWQFFLPSVVWRKHWGRMAELTLGIPWLCVAPSLPHALLGCCCSSPSPELLPGNVMAALCFGHQ